jgi:2-polyprenyl-3-methyl-5-hydroxy-6-metoxy-1,4-benzoquinol methylase
VYCRKGRMTALDCARMSEQATSSGTARQEDDAAEYGQSYYLNYWGGGGPYERNEHWLRFFGTVADGIIRDLEPSTVFDAGCAMGFLVEALRQRGIDASGLDVSEYAISQVDPSVAEHCRVGSLTEPLGGRFDLITCIEVLEHIPPDEIDQAIDNLCAAADKLLISTTPGDFGEPTHFNVNPPENWSAKFAQRGFFRDLEHDFSYLSPWAALYVRREEPVAETVRRYDRAWWRLRREAREVRESLLETQERLTEAEEQNATREELAEAQEEILRLRDLLVAKDTELGSAKGKVAELEDQRMRIAGVKQRVATAVPGLRTLIGAALRLLRGQR